MVIMLAKLEIYKGMGKVKCILLMAISMKVDGNRIKNMERVPIIGMTALNTKVNLRTTIDMAVEQSVSQVVRYIKVNSGVIKYPGMVYTHGKMETCIMGSGRMT